MRSIEGSLDLDSGLEYPALTRERQCLTIVVLLQCRVYERMLLAPFLYAVVDITKILAFVGYRVSLCYR